MGKDLVTNVIGSIGNDITGFLVRKVYIITVYSRYNFYNNYFWLQMFHHLIHYRIREIEECAKLTKIIEKPNNS